MTTGVMKSNYFKTPHPRNLPFFPTCPLRLAFSPTHLGVAIHNSRTTPTQNPSWPCEVNPCASESHTRCVLSKKSGEILQPSKDRNHHPLYTSTVTSSGFKPPRCVAPTHFMAPPAASAAMDSHTHRNLTDNQKKTPSKYNTEG